MTPFSPDHKAYLEMLQVLWRRKDVRLEAKGFWQYLGTYENRKTNQCCPTYETICRELNIHRRTVKELIDHLVEKKLLVVNKFKKGAFGRERNNYLLIAPQPAPKYSKATSGKEKIVPFPVLISTRSIPSTTPLDPSTEWPISSVSAKAQGTTG